MCRVCVEALGIETPLADSYWGKSIMVNRATVGRIPINRIK